MQFPISTRLRLLADVMKNPKISDAERRVYWLIAIERANNDGCCYCSNSYIAQQLGMHITNVIRAKSRLTQAGLISYEPGNRKTKQASFYKLTKGWGSASATHNQAPTLLAPAPLIAPKLLAPALPDQTKNNQKTRTIYLSFASSELQTQSDWERKTLGKEGPRDRSGGWRYTPEQLAPELRQ